MAYEVQDIGLVNPLTTCQICKKSVIHIRKHLRGHKDVTDIDYYDMFVGGPENKHCDKCGVEVGLWDMERGYRDYCKLCSRSESAIKMRAKLKSDPIKHAAFTEKVSKRQTEIWAERAETGEDKIIFDKAASANRANNALLTQEERNERYGWQNKLTDEERKIYLANSFYDPNKNWWKNPDIPEERKQEVRAQRYKTTRERSPEDKLATNKKQLATRHKLAQEDVDRWYADNSDRESYYKAVWSLTEMSYQYNIDRIDPDRKRGLSQGYALDHNFSIFAGYIFKVDPEIIAHPENLQMLENDVNLTKSAECWIELDVLTERVKLFNEAYKDTWYSEVINGT